MKFVYALISTTNDFYAEQAAMSMWSLKKRNPGAAVVLLSDSLTLEALENNRRQVIELADEVVAVDIPGDLTPVQRSRFLKTTMRQNVEGDFLYLDNDTVVVDSLDDLESFDGEVGAVNDCHQTVAARRQYESYRKLTGKKPLTGDLYFNGGILFARDTPAVHKFFSDWHELWDSDRRLFAFDLDQPSLNQASETNGGFIKELDGTYNCQLMLSNSKDYRAKAKILHYFSSTREQGYFFQLRQPAFLEHVRRNGLSVQVKAVLENPFAFFFDDALVLKGDALKDYHSPVVYTARRLARSAPWLNGLGRRIYRLVKTPSRFFSNRNSSGILSGKS